MPRSEMSRALGPERSPRLAAAIALALVSLASSSHVLAASRPAAQDTPYPGTIALHVDASDTVQGIFRVHETIPVAPGALTLLYPQWLPGDHCPNGPIAMLAGLSSRRTARPLAWTRDPFDVYAFHVDDARRRVQPRCGLPVPVAAATTRASRSPTA